MKLVKVTSDQLHELMGWFNSEAELRIWSGPFFNYPFDMQSFRKDLNLDALNSFALINDEGQMLGFGQYYLREGRCHLGRLVIAPSERGKGLAKVLINLLGEQGKQQLNCDSLSLFVYSHNTLAKTAYEKLGFIQTQYPEDMPLDGCIYMTC